MATKKYYYEVSLSDVGEVNFCLPFQQPSKVHSKRTHACEDSETDDNPVVTA